MLQSSIGKAAARSGAALLALLLALAGGAEAADSLDDRRAKRDRLETLRLQTKAVRRAAEADYAGDVAECQQRILVNDCIGNAKKQRLGRIEEARRLEAEESAIERDIRRAELAERRANKARALVNRPPPEITTSPEEFAPPDN